MRDDGLRIPRRRGEGDEDQGRVGLRAPRCPRATASGGGGQSLLTTDLDLRTGWVSEDLREEFPQLGLRHTVIGARPRRSGPGVKQRLALLSDRFTGGRAIHLRQEPIPWAYRVFFRQIGMDPDERRTPVEDIVLERMKWGGFRSFGLPIDAVVIATVETGVPLIALDADRVGEAVGLRLTAAAERLGAEGRPLAPGQIVVADERRPLALLFGDVDEGAEVRGTTRRILLAAVRVKGVPEVSVEEAVWTAVELLESGG